MLCSNKMLFLLPLSLLLLNFFLPSLFPTIFTTLQSTFLTKTSATNTQGLFQKLQQTRSLEGKNCLVTGSSRGLGKATARDLLRLGCDVFLAQRKREGEGEEERLREEARKEAGEGREVGAGRVVLLDLGDLESVERTIEEVETILKEEKGGAKLDVVVLNAAVVPAKTALTKQGFESSFGVNYLGHVHFTQLLLAKKLVKEREGKGEGEGEEGKVIFVLSEMHKVANSLLTEDIGCVKEYGATGSLERYAHSKICLTTYAVDLSEKLKKIGSFIKVLLYDPGPVNTEIARETPDFLKPLMNFVMEYTFKTPEASALPISYFSLAPTSSLPAAHYLLYWGEAQVAEEAWKDEERRKLREETERLLANRAPFRSC